MGILDVLFGPQMPGPQEPFDPFGENEFGPTPPPQAPQAPAGGLIGGGATPRPMSFGPAPTGFSGGQAPQSPQQAGFFSRMFRGQNTANNERILEANRRRFLPGGPLADVSPQERESLLSSPRNARRLIEARQGEQRLRNRPLTTAQKATLKVGTDKIADDRKRHEARVNTLDDPNGPFAGMNEATKSGLRGSPDVLKSIFEQQILGPAKLARSQALRPPKAFEPTIEKKRAEKFANVEEKILVDGGIADQTTQSLSVMENLLKAQQQGRFQPERIGLAEALIDIGMDPSQIPLLNLPSDVTAAQALDSVISAQRLVVLSAFKGNQTERELAFTKRTLPQLSNTPAGNELTLRILKRRAKLDSAMRDALEQHIESGGSPSSFGKVRRRIQRENPVWTSDMFHAITNAKKGGPSMTPAEVKAAKQRARPPKRINLN